jgi:YD repeat-containing protein
VDLSNRPRHTHRSLTQLRSLPLSDASLGRAELIDQRRQDRKTATTTAIAEPPRSAYAPQPVNAPQNVSNAVVTQFAELLETIDAGAAMPAAAEQAAKATGGSVAAPDAGELLALLAKEIEGTSNFDYEYTADISPALTHTAQSKNPHELIRSLQRMVADHENRIKSLASQRSPLSQKLQKPERRLRPRQLFREVKLRFKPVPHVETFPDGTRVECYDNGAAILKNALGKVVEVRSPTGETLSCRYDDDGNLQSFLRNDCYGKVHSLGERDRHQIIVRDVNGRVKAAGESMSVDPIGCLMVHNYDGQFVSLDLVRGLHIERRRVNGDDGYNTVTAVFTHDGFRMATRFHEAKAPGEPADGEGVDRLRFYGRDGSMIEFGSEEELRALRPCRVLPPASVHVDRSWRGKWQAGTAWEAVQEYLAVIS